MQRTISRWVSSEVEVERGIVYNHTYDRIIDVNWKLLAEDFNIPEADKFISGSLYASSPFLRQLGRETRIQQTVASLPKLPEVINAGIKLMNAVPSKTEGSGHG